MRKFVLPLIIVASLGASSLAMAATPSTAEGVIKSIDAKAMTLTLDNGMVYHLAKTIQVAALKAGEKVKITWEKVGAANDASIVLVE